MLITCTKATVALRCFALVALFGLLFQSVHAEVIIEDGFGDADVNNNGVPLEDGEITNSYEPPEFPGTMVNALDVVEDASDTGIPWFSARGWTQYNQFGASSHNPKATLRVVDDTTGVMPETASVPALNSGHALSFESRGRGSTATGFFGQSVELGPEVGDQVKVGFDFRTWQSASNGNNFTPVEVSELRFGLYQDTDNQLGMTNDFAGLPFDVPNDPPTDPPTGSVSQMPAVWGQANGHFRGDDPRDENGVNPGPGANGDHGWYARIELGTGSFAPVPGGIGARINEETNEPVFPGDGEGPKIMEGGDNDFVTKTDAAAPTFVTLDSLQAYRLELTLERATDLTPGDTIMGIFDVTNLATGEMWTLSGMEPVMVDDGMGNMIPDGISSDSWDYFAIRNTGADDMDLIIDNFKLEIFGSNENMGGTIDINGDSNVDCMDIDALVAELVAGGSGTAFDLDGNGMVNGDDLQKWLDDAGNQLVGGPFLPGDANLDGFVDVSDLNIWNMFKFTNTPAWCSGDFNADGFVDVSDLNIWSMFKFQSSDVAAVPEPASVFGLLIGLIAVARHKRRHC